ncbi:MAG: L-2-hydroxyglutarate oxidase, partial [Bacteroidota bacterium]
MPNFDVIIVGAGIVGLATALKIKEQKPQTRLLIIEKERTIAQHQTGHNSGVIHSGIYYKPGSLKAKNCREGYKALIEFCQLHEIPFELCGKLIVATDESEIPALDSIFQRGQANGLDGLKMLSSEEIKTHEPFVQGQRGIFVPQTGIIDYKRVAQVYAKLIQEKEGLIHHNERVIGLQYKGAQAEVFTTQRAYTTRLLINCSGLFADRVATLQKPALDVRIIPFRGEYYKLVPEKQYLVKNLIYPVPNPNFPFLGVHFTRMINGGIEAGPNAVFAWKREGYQKSDFALEDTLASLRWPGFRKVAAKYWKIGLGEFYRSYSKLAFTRALQKLIPDIQKNDLVPEEAGVRAQACDKFGGLLDDFKIIEENQMIHVLNAPSPAAT